MDIIIGLGVIVIVPFILVGMGRSQRVIDRESTGEGTSDEELERNRSHMWVAVCGVVILGALVALAESVK